MANGVDISAIAEACVEEKLLCSILIGPPEPCKGLLDSLDNVDVTMARQRTLLHVGVSLGKVEWVEELLGRGADPNFKDRSDVTALHLAEEMLQRYPDDSDRRQVSRMVRLVNRRDQAMRYGTETSYVGSAHTSTSPVVSIQHETAMAAFSSSMDALKEEMRLLRADLKSSLEVLKEQVCGRDALLRCLEAAVTSSAEQLTSLCGPLQEEATLGAVRTTLEIPHSISNMADERRECVDGMMRRTEFVYEGKKGVNRVRRLYQRLYDADEATCCLLQFLRRESRFVVKVDCGSNSVEKMKSNVFTWDGSEVCGSSYSSFAEFSSNTVYLGAKVSGHWTEDGLAGKFAVALAQMSLHLCFHNGGEPYEDGDEVQKSKWRRAFGEVRELKRKRGGEFDAWIYSAFKWHTRDSDLAITVPSIIAEYGSTEGTRLLREQVPCILDLYKEHVVATLLAKARVDRCNNIGGLVMDPENQSDKFVVDRQWISQKEVLNNPSFDPVRKDNLQLEHSMANSFDVNSLPEERVKNQKKNVEFYAVGKIFSQLNDWARPARNQEREQLCHQAENTCCLTDYICNYCSTRCSGKKSLALHIKRHMDGTKSARVLPKKDFPPRFSQRLLVKDQGHVEAVIQETSNISISPHNCGGVQPLKCNQCGKMFSFSSQLNKHSLVHSVVKAFKCNDCGKMFANKSHLKTHSVVHTGVKAFKCNDCGKMFNQKGNLKIHSLVHTGVKAFKCNDCGKMFSRISDLRSHSVVHTGVKGFKCDECGKTFTTNSSLRTHLVVHTGVKSFKCNECGKMFSRSKDLRTHSVVHTGEKRVKCDECGKRFTTSSKLKSHSVIHTGVKPFKCDLCGQKLKWRSGFSRHLLTHADRNPSK